MWERDVARRIMLRGLCAVTFALAAAIAVLGFLPGFDVHGDSLVRLAVTDLPEWNVCALVVLVAPGIAIWRRPNLGHAVLWAMLSVGVLAFLMMLMLNPGFAGHYRGYDELWPATAARMAVLALVVVQVLVLPVACAVLAIAMREPKPERLARATLITHRRRA